MATSHLPKRDKRSLDSFCWEICETLSRVIFDVDVEAMIVESWYVAGAISPVLKNYKVDESYSKEEHRHQHLAQRLFTPEEDGHENVCRTYLVWFRRKRMEEKNVRFRALFTLTMSV